MTADPPTQPTPSSEVFISYASQDKAVADAVCKALESTGVTCWIAPRDVTPGEFYAESIVHAIDSTKVIVLVLSKNGADSQHVLREVERASSKRHPVVSFRIDTAPLPAGLEYFLNTSQWLDASATGVDRALPRLVDAVKSALAQPSAAARVNPSPSAISTTPVATSTATPPKSQRKRILLAAGLAAVAIMLAALYVPGFWLAKHPPAAQPTLASTPAAAVSDKSIAVLPFTDMSEKHDQEYFGDGMAEEILDLLTKIPGLTVIGRTSSFQFKGKNEDLRTIGTKMNAAYVLEGSVRKFGEQVRITAQLINTRTGAHEWSETYDRPIGDVLKLQDSIAAAIARMLQLTVADKYPTSRSTIRNAHVYDLLLRGSYAAESNDHAGYDEATTLIQQALDLDPTSAEAAARLAGIYAGQVAVGSMAPAAGIAEARRLAAMALSLDPQNALAHDILGVIYMTYDWDWEAAAREFDREATLSPGSASPVMGKSALSCALGRWDVALQQIRVASIRDPLDPNNLAWLSLIQSHLGRPAEAEAAMRRLLDRSPNYFWAHYGLGYLLLARGDRQGALAEMKREEDEGTRQQGLAMAYFALGRQTESDLALTWLEKEKADDYAFAIATVYGFRGQSDEAMHWLERAYVQKDSDLYLIKGYSRSQSLEGDPRFKAFLRKMNLPE